MCVFLPRPAAYTVQERSAAGGMAYGRTGGQKAERGGAGGAAAGPCPADGVAGVPRAELIGDNEIFLEHYRGILAYGKEEIHVDGGGWVLRILGRNLEIKAMRAGELRIFGVVTSLTLL